VAEAQILSNISHDEETTADQYELVFCRFRNKMVQSAIYVVDRFYVVGLLEDASGVFSANLVFGFHRH